MCCILRHILFFLPSFSVPDVLCNPTDLIWRKGTPLEVMIGRTAPSSDGLLAEVFWGFPQLQGKCQETLHSPQDHFIITLIISDRRDWRSTRGNWTLARNLHRSWWNRHTTFKAFFGRRPWLQGQLVYMDNYSIHRIIGFIYVIHS